MRKIVYLLSLMLLVPVLAAGQTAHDSAIFLMDVSGTVEGTQGFEQAKEVTTDMLDRFPDYVSDAGVMSFGHARKPQIRDDRGVAAWDKSAMKAAISGIEEGNGPTPIGSALTASADGIEKAEGKVALILVSDGLDTGPADPVERASRLKDQFGDALCIFAIQLGDSRQGKELLADIVTAGGCGAMWSADVLTKPHDNQAAVDFIFPTDKTPLPPSPAPMTAPGDDDKDGVVNTKDQCPGTPTAADVDRRGCWVLTDVKFDSGSWEILPRFHNELDDVVKVMKENPDLDIIVEGHTDSLGSAEANQELSAKRAQAVKDYLVDQGISETRLTTKGYGEERPAATNETPAGRAENRRIELDVVR